MPSKFSTLAMELIELINILLGPADLRSLRLVCRELTRKTLPHFGLANFTNLRTDLTCKSLQRLQDISETVHLAVHVHSLRIKHTDDDKLGEGFGWRRHASGLISDHLAGTTLLRDVLGTKLLKCRSFHIDSYDEYKPRLEQDSLLPSDAVGIILSIVAGANLALRSFTVESSVISGGKLNTQRLPIPLSYTLRFLNAWSHIEELNFDFVITSDQYDWIYYLISSSPRLRKLSLGFGCTGNLVMERLSSSPSLKRLDCLSLRSVKISFGNISTLLLHNRETLRSLSLQHTRIKKEGKWATVLRNLQDQLPRLEHLLLFWIREQLNTRPARLVTFPRLAKHPIVPGSDVYRRAAHIRYASHQLETVKEPIRLAYWAERMVVGVEFHGSGIDQVLSALVSTAETV